MTSSKRYKHALSRRTFLRGAGAVAIGLPFLDVMHTKSVWGAPEDPPDRCITLFFGLGMPKAMQQEGFAGPLAPLEPFADKMRMFRNVDMSEAKGSGHPAGGTCVFVGEGSSNKERSTGPSIDQYMKAQLYPQGPPTALGTLAVGSFFRRSHGLYQRIRCWNPDGSRAVEPIEAPSDVFDSLFGSLPGSGNSGSTPEDARRERIARSVLDTVVGEYRHYTGERAGLSGASKAKLKDHLDRIRELERRLFDEDILAGCTTPAAPQQPNLPYGTAGATEYKAVRVRAQDFQAAYRLNAELYALALRCDLVRFGNIMFEASGGHTAFEGSYDWGGDSYNFRSEASNHNNWHESRQNDMWWHAHFFQSNIAYTLGLLDDQDNLESNGKSVLDNALIILGTETGTNHDMDGVFHAVAGGNGRFNLGGFHDERINAVDIYRSCLSAYGVSDSDFGSSSHFNGHVSGLIA